MTEINSAVVRHRARRGSPVYAFNTDSMQGLALATDLLAKGVNVSRAQDRLHRGRHAVLHRRRARRRRVAGRQGRDLAALAAARNTPVDRPGELPGRPLPDGGAEDRALHGLATVPSYPLDRTGTGQRALRASRSAADVLHRRCSRSRSRTRSRASLIVAGHEHRPRQRQAGERQVHGVHQPRAHHHRRGTDRPCACSRQRHRHGAPGLRQRRRHLRRATTPTATRPRPRVPADAADTERDHRSC